MKLISGLEGTTFPTVRVDGGTLSMGSSMRQIEDCVSFWQERLIRPAYKENFRRWIEKEFPLREVNLAPFEAMVFPVTNAEYSIWIRAASTRVPESIANSNPPDHPVWGVTLEEAKEFAEFISRDGDRTWTLPTEEQWEWMAKGPRSNEYPFGSTFDREMCNTVENGLGETVAVSSSLCPESWCGVCGLAGNIEEWTASAYAPYPGGHFIEDDLSKLLGRDIVESW